MQFPVPIHSRADRFKLRVERDALPVGFGASAVWPLVLWFLMTDAVIHWELVAWLIWPALALLVGVWRPCHRRYGLRRSDRWRAAR